LFLKKNQQTASSQKKKFEKILLKPFEEPFFDKVKRLNAYLL
jgi:hypothetical protein